MRYPRRCAWHSRRWLRARERKFL